MNTATVTVAYVNQPAEGKKQGNIKTDGGDYYGVAPAMLGQFQPKGKYEITYESRDYNGKTYHTVKTVKALGGPAPSTTGSGGKYGATDETTARRIFICGILNSLAHAGKISSPDDAKKWWIGLDRVWAEVHQPKITTTTKEHTEDEFQDSVPF